MNTSRTHLASVSQYLKVRDLYAAGRCSLALLEAAERVACRTEDAAYAAIDAAHAAGVR